MNHEFEHELTPDQWKALKNLRNPASWPERMNRFVIDDLITLGLVAMNHGVPMITPKGRKVLVRGSSLLLLDLAA